MGKRSALRRKELAGTEGFNEHMRAIASKPRINARKHMTNNLEAVNEIKYLFNMGKITYEEMRLKGNAIVEAMNVQGEVIAKKHGVRYKKLSFTSIFR